jgi:glycosyltransferase involved in cell wall biosynthesis
MLTISICIPQYNRIEFLLKSLSIIERQTYSNIEVVISDDCSTDDTREQIQKLIPVYKFPILFESNSFNKGFDYNLRKSIEMSGGHYAIVLGNDDTLNGDDAIEKLVDFLNNNSLPDLGFCNMLEERTGNQLIKRANATKIIGTGSDVALQYYSCFSFVGGLVFKRSSFIAFNTNSQDGSVFVQIYLAVRMVAEGMILFSIAEPLIVKDILLDGNFRNSYRDRIAKKWKNFKVVDGGLHSVINVLIAALRDSANLNSKNSFYIFKRIYGITFPHWILDYRANKALPEAFGLFCGMLPFRNKDFVFLKLHHKIMLFIFYLLIGLFALLFPVYFFNRWKMKLYTLIKKKN